MTDTHATQTSCLSESVDLPQWLLDDAPHVTRARLQTAREALTEFWTEWYWLDQQGKRQVAERVVRSLSPLCHNSEMAVTRLMVGIHAAEDDESKSGGETRGRQRTRASSMRDRKTRQNATAQTSTPPPSPSQQTEFQPATPPLPVPCIAHLPTPDSTPSPFRPQTPTPQISTPTQQPTPPPTVSPAEHQSLRAEYLKLRRDYELLQGRMSDMSERHERDLRRSDAELRGFGDGLERFGRLLIGERGDEGRD